MSERFVLNETSIFGRGCSKELPGEIKSRGFKKVLLVTDKGLVDWKLINKVSDLLDENQIDYTLYSEIKPNPTIKNVLDGYEICKNINADDNKDDFEIYFETTAGTTVCGTTVFRYQWK